MNLYEAIFVRKSVRNYCFDTLPPQTLDKIWEHYKEMPALFSGIGVDMAILDNRKGQERMLSMFSVKAPYYMAFYSEESERYLMNVGYIMEQMVLYLCSIGLGTCFIGSNRVKKAELEKNGKRLVGIVAFGKSHGSHTRRQSEAKRLPLEDLCVFKEVPRQWMTQMLEAARLSPSSMNSQPWRFVVYDNRIHIFSKKHSVEKLRKWDEVNFGIMFANMMVAAEELWLDVDLIRLGDISQKNFSNNQYVLSAILKAYGGGRTTSGVIGRARRHCGAAGEKKRAELVAQEVHGKMGTNAIRQKSDDFSAQCVLKSGVVHQISSHFLAHILHSQFLPSFSMPLHRSVCPPMTPKV